MEESILQKSNGGLNESESRSTETILDLKKDLDKKRIKYAIINTIGSVIHKLTFSVISNVSFLSIYYISHLYHANNEDKNIKTSSAITLSPISNLCQYMTIWIGGVVQKKIGIRLTVLCGCILLTLGALGIIFLKSLIGYQIMMGLYGFGMGISEVVTVSNACKFLPHKRGLIIGIVNVV